MKKLVFFFGIVLFPLWGFSQTNKQDTSTVYKKRVLEKSELDFMVSYYSQSGDNAAVTGGVGTEELTDFHPTVVVAIPINEDDVLTIDASVSAYSSASSSNVDPFDGNGKADAFQASSGASSSDSWKNVTGNYSHSSDDRNKVWSVNISGSTEYDYNSLGFGGNYTRLFNQKNTELSFNAKIFLDKWSDIQPRELRPFARGNGQNDRLFSEYTITGNTNYNPSFTPLKSLNRNSFNFGVNFSQILTKNMQASLSLDLVQQTGLLSTPFQRVYFSDVENSYIENFHLAEDIERMPDNRFKTALGGRLHYYINEWLVARTYYRYYFDNWGINSHTASIEFPIKIKGKFTVYPSYRYYTQTAADYFAPYDAHLSTDEFYTSDYDLSKYNANQFGLGVSYTDVLTKTHIWKWGLKSIDLSFHYYERNSGLKSFIGAIGFKFILD